MIKSFAMIKYLIMGIKKVFTKHYCEDCNVRLSVVAWKRCPDCDFKKYKYRQPTKFQKPIKPQTLSLHNYSTEIKGEILEKASILVTDGYRIIGYKL
jgi:hypothetical protein